MKVETLSREDFLNRIDPSRDMPIPQKNGGDKFKWGKGVVMPSDFRPVGYQPEGFTDPESIIIEDELHLTFENDSHRLIFYNVNFKKNIRIDGPACQCGLTLINCTFEKELSINACTEIKDNIGLDFLHIKDSNIKHVSLSGITNLNKNIIIEACAIENISLGNIKINGDKNSSGVSIKLVDIKNEISNFTIQNIEFVNNSARNASELFLSNIKINNREGNAVLWDSVWINSKLENVVFENNFRIPNEYSPSYINSVHFFACTFNKHFEISSNIKSLNIVECSFHKSSKINKIEENQESKNIEKLTLQGNTIDEQLLINLGFGECDLNIKCLPTSRGNIAFVCETFKIIGNILSKPGSINPNPAKGIISKIDCTLSGTNNEVSGFYFDHISFKTLSFKKLINRGDIRFFEGGGAKLKIEESDLGNMFFNNIRFNTFQEIYFKSSVLANVNINVFEESDWFKYERIFSDSPAQKRALFTQLKHAANNQSNRFDFLKFKAWEMQAKKEQEDKKEWNEHNFNEKIIFYAGSTNDFGLNWRKPLGWLFLFNICLFFLLFFLGYQGIAFAPAHTCEELSNTFKYMGEASPIFIRLFNPADFKLAEEYTRNVFLITGLLLLQKIGLGFFIYQIITAFRKYVK